MNLNYLTDEPENMIDTDCHIRWCIRRDLPEVLRIESEAFDFPWCEDDFKHELRKRNAVIIVADVCELVAGYVVYEVFKSRLYVVNFAVRHDCRRRGIGTLLVNKLKSKLNDRRRCLELEVRDTNLRAQQFFRANGFKAIAVVPEFYQDTDEDAYRFRYVEGRECSGKK